VSAHQGRRPSPRLQFLFSIVSRAIWLKSFRHKADKVIGVETIASNIRPLKVYPMQEFLDLLRTGAAMLAEHSQAMKHSPSRTGI
jgi:hypothetical protein